MRKYFILLIGVIFIAPLALADDTELLQYVTKQVNAGVNIVAHLLFDLNFDTANTQVVANAQQPSLQATTVATTTNTLDSIANNLLTRDNNAIIQLMGASDSITASDALFMQGQRTSTFGQIPSPNYRAGNQFFSASSLLDNDTLGAAGLNPIASPAYQFIYYVAQIADPIIDLDTSNVKSQSQQDGIESDPRYLNYQYHLRTLMAQRSLALESFMQLFSERLPTAQAQAATNIPFASTRTLQNYMATRRINSNTWHQNMATATPANIARETTYILAEIESQLDQLHRDDERIIALLSGTLIQNTVLEKVNLQQDQIQAQGVINNVTGSAPGQ